MTKAIRNVRNFWMKCIVDGEKTVVETGPVAKDGGMVIEILQRHGREAIPTATIVGTALENGILELHIQDVEGKEVYVHMTKRNK